MSILYTVAKRRPIDSSLEDRQFVSFKQQSVIVCFHTSAVVAVSLL